MKPMTKACRSSGLSLTMTAAGGRHLISQRGPAWRTWTSCAAYAEARCTWRRAKTEEHGPQLASHTPISPPAGRAITPDNLSWKRSSRMDKFRVLVVDDGLTELTAATDWLYRGADLLPAPPDIVTAGSAAEAAAAIKHCVRSGTVIKAAIVDLGLGPRQPSGLGVIQLLAQAGVPVAVWTDWGEGRRLMFVYAAFTWYQPVALMPKARVTKGAGVDRAARDFARDIVRIHRREALIPDLAAYFRPK